MEIGQAVAVETAPAKKKARRGRHGLGHVYDHRGNWWLDVRIRGTRHRMKLGAVKVLEKRDAYAIRDEKLKELLMPKAPVAKGLKPFSGLANEFVNHYTKVQPRKSWLKYSDKSPEQTPMQHCFRFFGDTPLRDITRSKVEDFMAHLRQRKVGKHGRRAWTVTTVTKNVSLLRAAFYWAIEKGYADTNPAAEQPMHENQGPERILEMEEEPKLFEQLPSWLRLMAIFCLQTATRRGDLLNLTWKAVHPETVEFLETKEIKKRIIPLSRDAKAVLAMLRPAKVDPNACVFESGTERDSLGWKLEREWGMAVERAGIPHIRFHDLRHTAGTRMVNAGIELQTVQRILGHASLNTTQRYLHSNDKQKQRAVETLSGNFGLYLPSGPEIAVKQNAVTATIQ